jgi:lipopolysaccharide/colanic/teichoic acid biosynthesis glycosyltransferase
MLTVLLLPVVIVLGGLIALAVFLDSPGPVFYRSHRVGRGGREFRMLKFRKMHRGAKGHPLTLADDERFTPIGRFLARTRLDELPQFWNVLRGEMRIVGPRPELRCFVDSYPEEYAVIASVTPGITGPAQLASLDEGRLLEGHEDPADAYRGELLPRKLEIDMEYVRTRSLRGDLAILLLTLALPARFCLRQIGRGGSGPVLAAVAAGVLVAVFAWACSGLS